jgi:hypothetical protein
MLRIFQLDRPHGFAVRVESDERTSTSHSAETNHCYLSKPNQACVNKRVDIGLQSIFIYFLGTPSPVYVSFHLVHLVFMIRPPPPPYHENNREGLALPTDMQCDTPHCCSFDVTVISVYNSPALWWVRVMVRLEIFV